MDNNDLQSKYAWKPYLPVFPELYEQQRIRIDAGLTAAAITHEIHHFGSSAVPDVGGKGIIDIYVIVSKDMMLSTSEVLVSLDYEARAGGGNEDRLFHVGTFADDVEGTRLYHAHVSHEFSWEYKEDILLRDWLRAHPEDAKAYSEIKKKASDEALKLSERSEMKKVYFDTKDPVIKEIIRRMWNAVYQFVNSAR